MVSGVPYAFVRPDDGTAHLAKLLSERLVELGAGDDHM